LGFYGITPNVGILIRDFEKPIGGLMFVLLTEAVKDAGKFKITPRLLKPNGEALADLPTIEVPITVSQVQTQVGFALGTVKFPHPGIYSFVLLVDEREHYQTTFSVEQGKPEDFND